ncbi:MAG: hypothetical protein M1826_007133 [Phylliscum demangeonii]|nr:MAG: hypothetical protein M1826_007133 [Phylliscum demangeonii]
MAGATPPRARFSLNRMILNAFPNFANDDRDNVDLTWSQKDDLFNWQMIRRPPPLRRYLNEGSFRLGGVVDSMAHSAQVYRALRKIGVVEAPPSSWLALEQQTLAAPRTDGGHGPGETLGAGLLDPSMAGWGSYLHTEAITARFANQMYCISVHAQRKLIGLLFWWEEELQTWRRLHDEEAAIWQAIMASGPGEDDGVDGAGTWPVWEKVRPDLTIALEAVRRRQAVLPSVRAGEEEHERRWGQAELPIYQPA